MTRRAELKYQSGKFIVAGTCEMESGEMDHGPSRLPGKIKPSMFIFVPDEATPPPNTNKKLLLEVEGGGTWNVDLISPSHQWLEYKMRGSPRQG